MLGPFTIIRTVNRNYWREDLESKETTSGTKFCCGSRTGAAQGREGCGKDGADARNTLVRVGKRKGRREEALRSSSLLPGKGQTDSIPRTPRPSLHRAVTLAWCSEFSDCRVRYARFVHH